VGYVTSEQILITKTGRNLTGSLGAYLIPTVADAPRKLNVALLPHDPTKAVAGVVYRSKAVGEPPSLLAMAVPSAVRAAVAAYRADHGLTDWFDLGGVGGVGGDLPLTADKVRLACEDVYTSKLSLKKSSAESNASFAFEKQ